MGNIKTKDGYRLMIPGFIDDETPYQIVLYDVQALLDLQQTSRTLEGHPALDLIEGGVTWGTAIFPAARVRRWMLSNRLLKVKANAGGTLRITYAEEREWRKYLTEEQWAWIRAVCEVSQAHIDNLSGPAETEAVKRERKPKVKAKERRARERNLEICH